jgi:hypothetical protein
MKRLRILLLLMVSTGAVQAAPVVLDSGARQVTLLELYTSQGCSSCPPAERWLNEYVHDADLWHKIVPVALHVDYWDYVGWKDPFASPENGARQRGYASAGRARGVYTPGFFSNGREWRGWTLRLPPRAADRTPGHLHAVIENGTLRAEFPAAGRPLDLHVAMLGSGIETEVKRGENHDRTLPQEFVLLAHAVHRSDNGSWQLPLPALADTDARRHAIALWVSRVGELPPLQATGGWLD